MVQHPVSLQAITLFWFYYSNHSLNDSLQTDGHAGSVQHIVLAERQDHLLRGGRKESGKMQKMNAVVQRIRSLSVLRATWLACAMPRDKRGRDQT